MNSHNIMFQSTPREGGERNPLKGDGNITYESDPVKRWPKSGTDSAKTSKSGNKELPADFAEIVAVWSSLPEYIKAAIKAMIETFRANSK